MSQDTTADDRSTTTKTTMAQFFAEERAEYEDADGFAIVYEDEQVAIVADHTGHELNEWASQLGVDRSELRATFRALADDVMGEQDAHEAFSYSDPVVFDKLD
jgi:hypothetical protein